MKTRAAVAWGPKQPLTILGLDLRPPSRGEVLVEIIAAGICKPDLDAWSGVNPAIRFPAIFGYEGAGVVRSAGKGTRLRPGEHVIPLFMPNSMRSKARPGSTHCIAGPEPATKRRTP